MDRVADPIVTVFRRLKLELKITASLTDGECTPAISISLFKLKHSPLDKQPDRKLKLDPYKAVFRSERLADIATSERLPLSFRKPHTDKALLDRSATFLILKPDPK
jgi:hypothetical protein